MKNYKFSFVLVAFFVMSSASVSLAQFDDLYFDPSTDEDFYSSAVSDFQEEDNYGGNDYNNNEEVTYDDEEYNYDEDEYDYYYSSRIKRFYRPYFGFGFYDPAYVDAYYYNPTYGLDNSAYIYSNSVSYGSYNRWNNSYNPYGYGGYSPYGSGYTVVNNNYGYGSYGGGGYSSYGGGGSYGSGGGYSSGYSSYYCPPSFNNPYTYTPTSYGSTDDDYYYGSRNGSTGTTRNSPRGGSGKFDNLNSGSDNKPQSARSSRNNTASDVYDVSGSDSRNDNKDVNSSRSSSRTSDYKSPTRKSDTSTNSKSSRSYDKPNRTTTRSSIFNNSRSNSNSNSSGDYNRSSSRNSSGSGSVSPSRSSSSGSSSSGSSGGSSRSSSSGGSSRGPR